MDNEDDYILTDRAISMEWIGIDGNCKILYENQSESYHTYSLIPQKAFAFKKLVYKDLYPGIDVIYTFSSEEKVGFEYVLVVKPGADLTNVRLRMGGDFKNITKDKSSNLIVNSEITGILSSKPKAFYKIHQQKI